nr:hypothetical protein [uncultured Campylobacter sp.]
MVVVALVSKIAQDATLKATWSLPALLRCRFACAKGANSVAPSLGLGVLPPL